MRLGGTINRGREDPSGAAICSSAQSGEFERSRMEARLKPAIEEYARNLDGQSCFDYLSTQFRRIYKGSGFLGTTDYPGAHMRPSLPLRMGPARTGTDSRPKWAGWQRQQARRIRRSSSESAFQQYPLSAVIRPRPLPVLPPPANLSGYPRFTYCRKPRRASSRRLFWS